MVRWWTLVVFAAMVREEEEARGAAAGAAQRELSCLLLPGAPPCQRFDGQELQPTPCRIHEKEEEEAKKSIKSAKKKCVESLQDYELQQSLVLDANETRSIDCFAAKEDEEENTTNSSMKVALDLYSNSVCQSYSTIKSDLKAESTPPHWRTVNLKPQEAEQGHQDMEVDYKSLFAAQGQREEESLPASSLCCAGPEHTSGGQAWQAGRRRA
eukprot:758617-Hanusia_phi.AAC.4